MKGIQIKLQSQQNSYLTSLERILQNDLNGLLLKEKQYWAIKSRINWINFGDPNTSFFHNSTLKRRRANKIHFLKWSQNFDSRYVVSEFTYP